jgi:hypothetical protein
MSRNRIILVTIGVMLTDAADYPRRKWSITRATTG